MKRILYSFVLMVCLLASLSAADDTGAEKSPPSDTIGFTTHDVQQLGSMGRQIEHRGTDRIHFDWMWQSVPDGASETRDCRYNAYDLNACALLAGSGTDVAFTRTGYVSLDVYYPTHWPIPAAHSVDPWGATGTIPCAFYDFGWEAGMPEPLFVFSADYPIDNFGYYQNYGTGPGNENNWPKIEMQIGTATVLHMVTTESGGDLGDPRTISYYRRVGDYGFNNGVSNGVWSNQHVIDTVMNINPVVVSYPGGDKVAIVWMAPAEYLRDTPEEFDRPFENDVWYAVSVMQGAEWAGNPTSGGNPSIAHSVDIGTFSGGNITQYWPLSDYKAFCDISALITTDGNLHVVWGARRWEDTTVLHRRNSGIFHWSENHPQIREVVIADWDTGGYCNYHTWSRDVGKMSLAECSNSNLYVLYTQFGKPENPCGDVDEVRHNLNGYLYMSASDDGGYNWDRGRRVTNTPETPAGCIPENMEDTSIVGTCNSEHWGSMARSSRVEQCGDLAGQNVLDILYINDRAPGGCIARESGVWTVNPVIWWSDTCRAVIYEPRYRDDAGKGYGAGYSKDILCVPPEGETGVVLTMDNPGLLANNWTLSVDYFDGDGWITANPSSGALASGGGQQVVELTFHAPAGAPDPSDRRADIVITHDAVGPNSPRRIPVQLKVTSGSCSGEFVFIPSSRQYISIIPVTEYYSTGYWEGPITLGTGVRYGCGVTGSVTIGEEYSLSAKIKLEGVEIGLGASYKIETSFSHTSGSNQLCEISVRYENSQIRRWRYHRYFGFWDWWGEYTEVTYGTPYVVPKCDELKSGKCNNPDDRTPDSDKNSDENLAPQDDSTYIVFDLTDFFVADSGAPPPELECPLYFDSLGDECLCEIQTVINAMVRFNDRPYEGIAILDADSLVHIFTGPLITGCGDCCETAGDANGDWAANIGDAVYLINYAFKGGPAPPCLNEGDANVDCQINVGDAVYLINYTFKGGPSPQCGCVE